MPRHPPVRGVSLSVEFRRPLGSYEDRDGNAGVPFPFVAYRSAFPVVRRFIPAAIKNDANRGYTFPDPGTDAAMTNTAASPSLGDSNPRPSIGFIGAGSLATNLTLALSAAGWNVRAIASRSPASAQRLADLIPSCRAEADPQSVVDRCHLVFLTVPDDAISRVASSLTWTPGRAVVHCCGAATSDILSPAAIAGALCGSFHPLQTFIPSMPANEDPSTYALARMQGITFAVEGSGWLLQTLETMASDLGGNAIHVRPTDRPLYHASAVMSCGALVALLHSAASLWKEMGVDNETAFRSLLPLARATLENAANLGPEAAATGPVVRGDIDTVRSHLEALRTTAPGALRLYVELTRAMITLKPTLDNSKLRQLYSLLDEFEESALPRNPDAVSTLPPANRIPAPNRNDGGPHHA